MIVANVLYNVKGVIDQEEGRHGWLLAKLLFVVLQICAWTVMYTYGLRRCYEKLSRENSVNKGFTM